MFDKHVDCIVNGSPHSDAAKEFVGFFNNYDKSENSYFLRVFITFILFQKTEFLQKDQNFSIDIFEKYLKKSLDMAKLIDIDFDVFSSAIDNTKLKSSLQEFDISTQEHYGNLFKNFSEYHYYEESYELLKTRFERNNIEIGDLSSKVALDDGCGGGRYTIALKKIGFGKVHGIDWSQININTAKQRCNDKNIGNVQYDVADVHELPFENEHFDFVFSNGVLHHTTSIRKGLEEIYRVLKIGGSGWLYVMEKPGGIHWDMIEILRNVMDVVPQEYARSIFRMLGVPENRLYYILDHIQVPINKRSSIKETEELLSSVGFKNIKRLNRGTDFDRIENIYKMNEQKNVKDISWKFGVGENRFLFKK